MAGHDDAMTPWSGAPVLVAGAAGQVGRLLVPALLARGVPVVAHSRDAHRLDELARAVEAGPAGHAAGLGLLSGALADDDAPAAVQADYLGRFDRPQLVVAALGGWQVGPPVRELCAADWERTVAGGLTAHFHAARAFLPLVAPGGAYVFLNGIASVEARAGAAAVCVTGAGEDMLVRVLREEEPADRVRVGQLVILGNVVAEDDRVSDEPIRPSEVCLALEQLLLGPPLDVALSPSSTHGEAQSDEEQAGETR